MFLFSLSRGLRNQRNSKQKLTLAADADADVLSCWSGSTLGVFRCHSVGAGQMVVAADDFCIVARVLLHILIDAKFQ